MASHRGGLTQTLHRCSLLVKCSSGGEEALQWQVTTVLWLIAGGKVFKSGVANRLSNRQFDSLRGTTRLCNLERLGQIRDVPLVISSVFTLEREMSGTRVE